MTKEETSGTTAAPGSAQPLPTGRSLMSPVAVGIAVLTLVKVAIAVRTELGSNEAYHWLYAQHPALGYYNHPAMVAWMIGLSTALFGHGCNDHANVFIRLACLK